MQIMDIDSTLNGNPICEQCFKEYIAKNSNQKYCSQECLKIARKFRTKNGHIKRICNNKDCRKEFQVSEESNPKKYCSRSCSATINNRKYVKRKKQIKDKTKTRKPLAYIECVQCSKTIQQKNIHQKYCSQECSQKFHNHKYSCSKCPNRIKRKNGLCLQCSNKDKYEKNIQKWLNGEIEGGSDRNLSTYVRRYLLEQAGYKCKVCGFNEVHPADGRTILEVNHIDGDGSNHSPDNLEVLCPNHHALTDTYRGRNQGNGRKVYYLRVQR